MQRSMQAQANPGLHEIKSRRSPSAPNTMRWIPNPSHLCMWDDQEVYFKHLLGPAGGLSPKAALPRKRVPRRNGRREGVRSLPPSERLDI